jgi:hypothetical protein
MIGGYNNAQTAKVIIYILRKSQQVLSVLTPSDIHKLKLTNTKMRSLKQVLTDSRGLHLHI